MGLNTHPSSLASKLVIAAILCVFCYAQNVSAQGVGAGGAAAVNAAAGAADDCPEDTPLLCRARSLYLLQPLDDKTKNMEPGEKPLDMFIAYFNMGWPWLLGIAAGIAIVQAVWGGILIMTSAGDIDEGKEKIQWAMIGMVMIILAGVILRFLNPLFYK